MKWISVKERLPEEKKLVWFYCPEEKRQYKYCSGWRYRYNHEIFKNMYDPTDDFWTSGSKPTHWAEIEPPKDEE